MKRLAFCSAVALAGLLIGANPAMADNQCVPAPESLVSWWSGDGNANDIEGANDGAPQNGAMFGAGYVSQAFSLDGHDDMVVVPDSSNLKPAELTLSAWLYFASLDGTRYGGGTGYPGLMYIAFKRNTRTLNFVEAYSILKFRGATGDRFSVNISAADGAQTVTTSITTIAIGQWYHVAASYDGLNVRLYVNGILERSLFHGRQLDHSTRPFVIGRTAEDGEPGETNIDGAFNGLIDEVQIYNRALSDGEVAAIYNAGAWGVCKDEDGDGFRPPDDCDETDSGINPEGVELPGNVIDENCDGNLGECSPCIAWRSHGEYIRCTSQAVTVLVNSGVLTEEAGDALVASAARSDVGKKSFVPPPECSQ